MPYYIKKESVKKKPRKSGTRTLINKLDKIFSLYIRLRDSKPFGYKAFKCISCGQIKPFAKADCGHYYSRSKMSTRYDEDNCHSECNFCNRFKIRPSGRLQRELDTQDRPKQIRLVAVTLQPS